MIKSYKALETRSAVIGGREYSVTINDVLYLDETVASQYSDLLEETTAWKTIAESNVDDSGTVTKTLTFDNNSIAIGGKVFTSVLTVSATGDNNMPTGTTITAVYKNAAGDTLDTKTTTIGAITKGSSSTWTMWSGAKNAVSVTFTVVLIAASGGENYDASVVITPADIANDIDSVIFTEGASVAATNGITTAIQLKDSAGADLTKRGIVEVFACTSPDAPAALGTSMATGTNGATVGIIDAAKSLLVLSEIAGTIDITCVNDVAATYYLGVRLPNGEVYFSDALIWTA